MKVGIVDYGGGNLRSLRRAVESLGHDVTLVNQAEHFGGLSHLFFPGQGAYGDCLGKLTSLDLAEPIREWIAAGKPFFGICVGYQLLFESSEEAPQMSGLGIIGGEVTKFKNENPSATAPLKIPHMGWNSLEITDKSHPLWRGLDPEPYFYFVHSYRPVSVDPSFLAASCQYGGTFAAAIAKGTLVGTQFHPEKSQHNGLTLLANFLAL